MTKKNTLFIVIFFLGLTGCIPFGAGTHGKIESFTFDKTNDEIVLMVDQFLLNNPEYVDFIDSTTGYGWIHIKIPANGNRYGFSIGGNSEIVLIQASEKDADYKFGHKLWFFQRNKFKNDFQKNFINELNRNIINRNPVYREPFTLTINKNIDTTLWPEYFLTKDTLLKFPLPNEFDTMSVDYFKDLIEYFVNSNGIKTFINQNHNFIRINEQCTGFIHYSIIIFRFYRRIGQDFNFNTLFETNEWKNLIDNSNNMNRLKAYSNVRQSRISKNYSETDVFAMHSEELWMQREKIAEINAIPVP